MTNPCQDDLREKVARKTRRIVDRQSSLELAEFLAQGQRRSRQQRKVSVATQPLHLAGLQPAVVSA